MTPAPPAIPLSVPDVAITHDTLLGGRVMYHQFHDGYRTGLEPVFMAALVPARPGQRVLEAGCGAGAGLLCLTERIHDLVGTGVELDPAMAELARKNLALNHRTNLQILQSDIRTLRLTERFDHVMANPPWHPPTGTPCPDARRDLARRARDRTPEDWIKALAGFLTSGGSLTLAIPASLLARTLAACEHHRIGSTEIVPLWPGGAREARIVLVRGRHLGRGGTRMLPGLTLHRADRHFTEEAESILRDGHAFFPDSFGKSPHRHLHRITAAGA
ncbi:tRNA1(Val) (adenine(37)-N6)-methyltransferase [Acetobacter estunensis]|uniref:tRNA1(Val) (adenine(37)-N6)-methyltransferase n=1 Tax=Acetobacter estunensis TaxID=104097 RepID=UPI0034A0732A